MELLVVRLGCHLTLVLFALLLGFLTRQAVVDLILRQLRRRCLTVLLHHKQHRPRPLFSSRSLFVRAHRNLSPRAFYVRLVFIDRIVFQLAHGRHTLRLHSLEDWCAIELLRDASNNQRVIRWLGWCQLNVERLRLMHQRRLFLLQIVLARKLPRLLRGELVAFAFFLLQDLDLSKLLTDVAHTLPELRGVLTHHIAGRGAFARGDQRRVQLVAERRANRRARARRSRRLRNQPQLVKLRVHGVDVLLHREDLHRVDVVVAALHQRGEQLVVLVRLLDLPLQIRDLLRVRDILTSILTTLLLD